MTPHGRAAAIAAYIACQAFVVLFIALHDWVPLGRLNDPRGARAADPPLKLALVTLASALPFAIALAGTVRYASGPFPAALSWLLWVAYAAGLYGLLRTWYVPYLLVDEPLRAQRYATMFAGTHTFLPRRNGIAPNTLHVVFHAVFFVMVLLTVYLTVTGVLSG